jgi:hypothetical protein
MPQTLDPSTTNAHQPAKPSIRERVSIGCAPLLPPGGRRDSRRQVEASQVCQHVHARGGREPSCGVLLLPPNPKAPPLHRRAATASAAAPPPQNACCEGWVGPAAGSWPLESIDRLDQDDNNNATGSAAVLLLARETLAPTVGLSTVLRGPVTIISDDECGGGRLLLLFHPSKCWPWWFDRSIHTILHTHRAPNRRHGGRGRGGGCPDGCQQ